MKRLGMFSGKIYSEEDKTMNECSLCITEKQANDNEYISKKKEENLSKCGGCFGCPMSNMMI
ncbi:hypothetical protein [Konateibacter massiliensis]|uniref:hypothetical protein n=1 Tax=Konateibacter massiliensis TaxID=2002841 RepID=UPI000C1512AD|nr:hypothetical protein [Konateibacter massiliensis]